MADKNDERIWNSLEKLHDKVDVNSKTLIENSKDLKYHIKRTDLLEESMECLDKDLKKIGKTQTAAVTIFKFLSGLLVVTGTIIAIIIKINSL